MPRNTFLCLRWGTSGPTNVLKMLTSWHVPWRPASILHFGPYQCFACGGVEPNSNWTLLGQGSQRRTIGNWTSYNTRRNLRLVFCFWSRAPKDNFPAPDPFKTGRRCLNASGMFLASNLHVEMGETIVQSMIFKHCCYFVFYCIIPGSYVRSMRSNKKKRTQSNTYLLWNWEN